MIKNLKIASLFLLGLLVSACSEDDSTDFQAELTAQPVALELDITSILLDASNVDNPAVTISWEEADYNVPTEIKYDVQMATNAEFTDVLSLGTVTKGRPNAITLTVNDLNKKASQIGLAPFNWSDVYVRVNSSIGTTNSLAATSNTVVFEIYPFFTYPFKDLYLVGNATEADWNNNNENPLLYRDSQNDNLYTYTGRFLSGDMAFKLLEVRGQWQPQWGTNGGSEVNVNDGSGDDPGVFSVPTEGYYSFTIDLAERTFSIDPFDEASATDYTQVTITGSSTTEDVAMTQSTFDPHIWSVLSTDLNTGGIQFSLDGTLWGGTSEFSGQASTDAGEIPIPVADAYEIWFNDLSGKYGMIPINLSN